jgi:hypothetical protein
MLDVQAGQMQVVEAGSIPRTGWTADVSASSIVTVFSPAQ